jgi:hypothetical protein
VLKLVNDHVLKPKESRGRDAVHAQTKRHLEGGECSGVQDFITLLALCYAMLCYAMLCYAMHYLQMLCPYVV